MSRTEVVIFPHIMWPMLCWQIPDRMQYLCVVSHTELTDVWQITVLHKSCKPCSAGKCLTGYSTSCIVSHVDLTNVPQITISHVLWAMLSWQISDRLQYLMCCEPCWSESDKHVTDYSTTCVVSHVMMYLKYCETCRVDKCLIDYSTSCVVRHVELTNIWQITVPNVMAAMLSWQTSDRLQYLMYCEPC